MWDMDIATKAGSDTKKLNRYRYLETDTDTDTLQICGNDDNGDWCSARGQVQGDAMYQQQNVTQLVMANEVSTDTWRRSFSCR